MAGWDKYIDQYKGSLDPNVIRARIQVESGGNPNVVAKPQQWKTGYGSEIGLLQMSPDTRKQYGITDEQAKDPETNLRVQLKQWNDWSNNFFGNNQPSDPVARNTWAWLTTAVGPGAVRRIRDLTGGDYSLSALARVADNSDVLGQNKKYWGSQSPGLVSKRIKHAIKAVTTSMGGQRREPMARKPQSAWEIMGDPRYQHKAPDEDVESRYELPGRLAPDTLPTDEQKVPYGLPSNISLDNLNKVINAVGDKAAAETDEARKAALIKRLRELQIYRLRYSGSHQPAEGTSMKYTGPQKDKPTGDLGLFSGKPLELPGATKGSTFKSVDLSALRAQQQDQSGSGSGRLSMSLTGMPSFDKYTEIIGRAYGDDPNSQTSKMIRAQVEANNQKLKAYYNLDPDEIKAGVPDLDEVGGIVGKKRKAQAAAVQAYDDGIKYFNDRIKALGGYKTEGGRVAGIIERVESRLNSAEAEVRRAYNDIKNAKTDPMGDIPMWAVAMIGIGAGLQNMGKPGAGNALVNVLGQVMSAKKAAARAKLEKLMDIHKLSVQQRDYLSRMFEKRLAEKENVTKSRMQLMLSKAAAQEKSANFDMAAADGIIALGKSKVETEFTYRTKAADKLAKAEEFKIKQGMQFAKMAAKMAKSAGKKALPAKLTTELANDLTVIKQVEHLGQRVKGKDLSPVKEMLGIFGTDAGRILPQVRAMARMIGRHQGVDKGNFAEKEGAIMVEAITGKDWNKAAQSYKRLMELYNDSVQTWQNKVGALGRSYDVSGLIGLLGKAGPRPSMSKVEK